MRKVLLVIAASLLAIPEGRPSAPRPRALTLEDRVRAQLAIDRVYYSYQEGTNKPFEKAVSQEGVEQKVRTVLKQSLALEKFWHTPVTAAMLHAESERMARTTPMPGRLRELYAALGDDSFLIDETLARSVLINRLVRNFYAYDQRLHGEERRRGEAVREMVRRLGPDSAAEGAERVEVELSLSERPDSPPATQSRSPEVLGGRIHAAGVRRLTVSQAELEQARAQAPANIAEIGPVKEDGEGFTIQALLESRSDRIRIANYKVPKKSFDIWWREVRDSLREHEVEVVAAPGEALPEIVGSAGGFVPSAAGPVLPATTCTPDNTWLSMIGNTAPGSRRNASVVWTGSRMIVWGGASAYMQDTGSSYDPATDTWTPVSKLDAPAARHQHTAVWTGSRMIVFGGRDVGNVPLYDGGLYDPLNDQWSPMNSYGAGPGRYQHTAVWTGNRMVVWGGLGQWVDTYAHVYDPSSNAWSLFYGTTEGPTVRYLHSAVWTGTEMVIWGGFDAATGNPLKTGGRYNPVTDIWTATRVNPGAPPARFSHSAVWTGSRMLIWGGSTAAGATSSGAKYDPVGNTWESMAGSGAPVARYSHSAIWTGGRMIVWGGTDGTSYFSSGGSYDPLGDAWSATSGMNAPPGRQDPLAAWTGSQMVVWGGTDGAGYGLLTGGRYDAASDSWTPVSVHDAPESGAGNTTIWTGSHMVVWGGGERLAGFPVATGGRYDPATNDWSHTSLVGVPTPRYNHTAVWAGTHMIVWGGTGFAGFTNEGGRYDPILDSWSSTSTINTPAPREGHDAVWTGSEMIVWGGTNFEFLPTDTGGRYNPASDTWVPTSTVGAPTQTQSTVVWTGSRMVIWGGRDAGGSYVNTGARYDPSTDTWQATSTLGAPSQRTYHTAVWTGSRMVIFGGYDGPHPCGSFTCSGLADGGRYDPVADSWQPMATNFRIFDHTAVWAGPSAGMITWGGRWENFGVFGDIYTAWGFRYNPATNTWSQISGSGAPRERIFHTAIWTGSFMIVWGGETYYPDLVLTDGGRYAFGQGLDDDGDGFS